jgi:hypothetical protein
MIGGDLQRPAPTASLEGLELTTPAGVEFDEMPANGTLDGFEATSFEAPPEGSIEPAAGVIHDAPESADTAVEADHEDHGAGDVEFLDISAVDDAETESLPDVPRPLPAPPRPTPLSTPVVPPPQAFGGDDLSGIELDSADLSTFGSLESSGPDLGGLPMFAESEAVLEVVSEPEAVVQPPAPPPAPPAPARAKRPTPSYVNLSDILHEEEEPKSARMTIGEPKQTGDHEADFQHILQEFRDGIEKTIPVDDADSHFDLGIAFREMGLIDDAIAEFQIASRSRLKRVESIEALGGCFLDKQEPGVARTLLLRALDDPTVAHGDDTLRGVLYLLGLASEALGAREDGLRYYQRVYAVDIRFRDVAARIQTLQQPA